MPHPIAYITRRSSFSASHRLHSPLLSDEENRQLFGKCNYIHGHGHNYVLEVTLRGAVDSKTGIIMNLVDLKEVIENEIMARMDHKHLNLDVPEFRELNPTAENIAFMCWQWLQPRLPNGLLYEVKLYETENNMAIYRGENSAPGA